MHPLLILAIAVAIVLVSILAFRLHAFLALTLAALVVALLTPPAAIERFRIEKKRVGVTVDPKTDAITLWSDVGLPMGLPVDVVLIGNSGRFESVAQLTNRPPRVGYPIRAGVVSGDTERLRDDLRRGGVLAVTSRDLAAARKAADATIGERVATAFGTTCGKIGILIALAAIIGKCLLDSGSADRIVRSALKVVGESGAPTAFVGCGFLLGIPVFFDTVFYLMMPLGKAMTMRTGRNYLLYVLTIVAGGSMAHSLVPPTPGPLFVAEELGIDIGAMILAGCCVGLCSSTAAYFYARWVNRRAELPLRESVDFSLKDLEELAKRDESQLPPLSLAVLPILLPVVLIAGNTILSRFGLLPEEGPLKTIAATLGNKNIALAIATIIAILTLVRQQKSNLRDLADSMQSALASGGVIILITAAGGSFGAMLQQAGVVGLIRGLPQFSPLVILSLAFLITTAIRSAQGSATVAMITAVGILAGFAAGDQLGCHPVYLALAIGCGSKPIAWMNDSGFWVICKMSGMTEAEGLRFVTPMSILMGLVGLLATLVGAALFPMVGS